MEPLITETENNDQDWEEVASEVEDEIIPSSEINVLLDLQSD